MQNFILVTLILGLAFFLYLIKSGEINTEEFNIKRIQGPAKLELVKTQTSSINNSSTLRLNARGTLYDLYTFSGAELKHVPRNEYYMSIYNIPLAAKDAVSGTWLGSRYVFYLIEEEQNGSEFDIEYKIYKTEYPTDSTKPVEYTLFKSVKSVVPNNRLEVRY